MRITWLPEVLASAGLDVDTYPGWEDRGSEVWGLDNPGFPSPLRGLICHATAGSQTSTDEGEMRTLWITGSTSAPAPISQCYLSRSGRWVVGATGRCNHVLRGDKGPHEGFGNYQLIGVEAQNDNRGEPWSTHMLDSYVRGVAAICAHMNWLASTVVAHREHQSGKSDPFGIDMGQFRADVQAILTGGAMANPYTLDNLDRWLSAILTNAETVTGVKDPRGAVASYPNHLHVPIPTTGGGGTVAGPVDLTDAAHQRIKADTFEAVQRAENE
jgi:hypothetical protein